MYDILNKIGSTMFIPYVWLLSRDRLLTRIFKKYQCDNETLR